MKDEQDFLHFRDETYNLGVFSPVVGGFYFGSTLSGIARAAKSKGHRITAIQTFEADLDRGRFPENAYRNGLPGMDSFDGEIVVTSALEPHTFAELKAKGKPLVCIGNASVDSDVPTVSPDNRGGVKAAIEHLIWHGHTEIGFVGNPQQWDVRERFDAYRETLRENGIEFQESWVIPALDNQEGSGAQAARVFVERGLTTTATFVATDRNAIGYMKGLREAGLKLPADHALIAFDHSEAGGRIRPRLSTVDPHHDRVGELATHLLLEQLGGVDVARTLHTSPSTLVTRESCGCVETAHQVMAAEGALRCETEDAFAVLEDVAESVFSGSTVGSNDGRIHVGAWVTTITEIVRAATIRALTPSPSVLSRIADATTALQPHSEALEALLTVLRRLEMQCLTEQEGRPAAYQLALRTTMTRLSIAITKGCTRSLLNRTGALERTLSNQYEVDLALMRVDVSNPRTLSWLPANFKGGAALALWTQNSTSGGTRELEIVGSRGVGSTGSRLVGVTSRAANFPPANLSRALSGSRHDILFIIPVTFAGSDWGLLAIAGTADTRSTSARDRFNHWAAMLAVALDHEKMITELREKQTRLEELAAKRQELSQAVRDSEERFALASAASYEGMWDWDVLSGKVYYSPQWCKSLGILPTEVGPTLESWTDRVHPDDQTMMQIAIAQQLAGMDEPFHLYQRIRNSNGEFIQVQVRGLTLTNDAGIPARIVGSISTKAELIEAEFVDQMVQYLESDATGITSGTTEPQPVMSHSAES